MKLGERQAMLLIAEEYVVASGRPRRMARLAVLLSLIAIAALAQSRAKSVVFVIDRSGSMAGQRIDETRAAVANAISELSTGDRAALITFNSEVELVVSMTADLDLVRESAGRMRAAGGTDFAGALEVAISQLYDTGGHIVLVTDGVAPSDGLRELARRMATHRVALHTIALGSDADEALLRELSNATSGQHATASAATIRRVLARVVRQAR